MLDIELIAAYASYTWPMLSHLEPRLGSGTLLRSSSSWLSYDRQQSCIEDPEGNQVLSKWLKFKKCSCSMTLNPADGAL